MSTGVGESQNCQSRQLLPRLSAPPTKSLTALRTPSPGFHWVVPMSLISNLYPILPHSGPNLPVMPFKVERKANSLVWKAASAKWNFSYTRTSDSWICTHQRIIFKPEERNIRAVWTCKEKIGMSHHWVSWANIIESYVCRGFSRTRSSGASLEVQWSRRRLQRRGAGWCLVGQKSPRATDEAKTKKQACCLQLKPRGYRVKARARAP